MAPCLHACVLSKLQLPSLEERRPFTLLGHPHELAHVHSIHALHEILRARGNVSSRASRQPDAVTCKPLMPPICLSIRGSRHLPICCIACQALRTGIGTTRAGDLLGIPRHLRHLTILTNLEVLHLGNLRVSGQPLHNRRMSSHHLLEPLELFNQLPNLLRVAS